ncbi:MAG TPA: polysaccharide biosynthesis/export family protein [Vicinamibacteria bacterium]|nr:polysaccharide biosynthesis/export family protein [Vicinamibacteria bacterium]
MSRVHLAFGLFLLAPLAVVAQAPPPAAKAPAPAAPALVGQTDYQIGPSDILSVTVYGHPDLTQTLFVQPDGTFTFPLVGRVKGSDMTPAELEKKLVILLARGFIRNPQVTVVVQEYRSKTVYVVGEVARPGPYPLSGRTTLVEVLAKAGPTTAAGAEVVVVRPQQGIAVAGPVLPTEVAEGEEAPPDKPRAEVIRVTVSDLQAGALEKNLFLQPNDTVYVPQAPKVFVTGEVRNPGAYGWFPGMTTRQLISVAGGLTPDGSDGRLKVVRQVDGQSAEDKIKLDEPVKPGDTVVVRRRLF